MTRPNTSAKSGMSKVRYRIITGQNRIISYHFLKGVPENSIFSKAQNLLFLKLDGKD